MHMSHWALLVGALVVTGCNGAGNRAERPADSGGMIGRMDSGGMGPGQMDGGGMGMGGMNMQGMATMPGMRAHMDSMVGMSPRQMQAMMATHQGMMSRMMDGMGADMRGMQMSGSPAWTALADSVKRDLAELPGLEGQALSTRMQAHAERARRLMVMHEQMMGQ